MVNRQDGAPDGFTPEQMIEKIPRLVSLEQTDNRNIYFTPISETKHHLVIDDLSPESLAEMLSDGYEPCAIIETSPNNWQAVITIPKAGTSLDRLAANEIVAELNKKYGDPKFSGEVHAHRAPGFENRKPKHERPDGTHPETKLVKSKRVECGKTKVLYDARLKEIADREAKRIERIADVDRLTPPDTAKTPAMIAYAIHFKNIYEVQTKRSLETGKPIDMSRLDMMTAVRLRMTGHSRDDVKAAISVMSPSLRSELGKDPNAHKWEDYAARTAAAAFGYYGDGQMKNLVRYADYWDSLESSSMPKPLSIEADKPRLAELAKTDDLQSKAERDLLDELHGITKYLGYIANPISQPTQHADQQKQIMRVLEIERSRGLSEAETVAKHECVQKFFAMVDKYRGGTIDRQDKDLGR